MRGTDSTPVLPPKPLEPSFRVLRMKSWKSVVVGRACDSHGSEPINRGSNPWGATTNVQSYGFSHQRHLPEAIPIQFHEYLVADIKEAGESHMGPDTKPESKGWWQTLPGLLTAAAAIITAVTGLLVAVHQTGFFDRSPQPPPQTQSKSLPVGKSEAAGAATPPAAGVTASRQLTLPEMTEVRFGQSVFKLVSARLDPYSPDKVSLVFTIRMTNNDRFDTNFWSPSFRLLAGGLLQSPTNNLNELLASNSSKQGDVEFVIPANISTVGLQMGDVGEGKPTITISLQNAAGGSAK